MKLLRKPEAVATLLAIFESVDDAARTVADDYRRRHYSGGAGDA